VAAPQRRHHRQGEQAEGKEGGEQMPQFGSEQVAQVSPFAESDSVEHRFQMSNVDACSKLICDPKKRIVIMTANFSNLN